MADATEVARMVAALLGNQQPDLTGNAYVGKNFPNQAQIAPPQPALPPMLPPWAALRTRLPVNLR
jgi:hypothetical protein